MKTVKWNHIQGIFLLLLLTFVSGCFIVVADDNNNRIRYRERHRFVWVGDTYYEQVYYIDGRTRRIVIIRERPVRQRRPGERIYYNDDDDRGRRRRRVEEK